MEMTTSACRSSMGRGDIDGAGLSEDLDALSDDMAASEMKILNILFFCIGVMSYT